MALCRSSISASGVLLFTVTLLLVAPTESRSKVSVVDTTVQNSTSTDVEAINSALLVTEQRNLQDVFTNTDLKELKINTSSVPQPGAAFKLAMQWPASTCDPSLRACRPLIDPEMFTIHGLWPEPQPNPCNGAPFDISQILSSHFLITQLNIFWPNVLGNVNFISFSGDNENFWTHEWESHGRCSGFIESDYFIRPPLLANYHLNRVNVVGAITQRLVNNEIDENILLNTLERCIGNKVSLKCNQDYQGRTQLQEIHLYFKTDNAGRLILEDIPRQRGCGGGMIQFP